MEEAARQGDFHRRELLRRAVYLVGGSAALGVLEACSEGKGTASTETVTEAAGRYFSPERMTLLNIIADVTIPQTDTPGAKEAGVPAFIDAMMVNWASKNTQAEWDGVIDAIDEKAVALFGAPLASLEKEQQFQTVKTYDEEAFSLGANAYGRFKELLLLGYYHSEPGATQELHYELVPGVWNACAPLSEVGTTWAD